MNGIANNLFISFPSQTERKRVLSALTKVVVGTAATILNNFRMI